MPPPRLCNPTHIDAHITCRHTSQLQLGVIVNLGHSSQVWRAVDSRSGITLALKVRPVIAFWEVIMQTLIQYRVDLAVLVPVYRYWYT